MKKFKETEDDPAVRKTIVREVKVLRLLNHENCIKLIEAFRRKKKLYLVFEYVEQNLLHLLEDYPTGIQESRVRRIIFQLTKAIAFCHSKSVLHRGNPYIL